jgi:hypothetical protein
MPVPASAAHPGRFWFMGQDECKAVANLAGIHEAGRSPNAGFEHDGVTDKPRV